MATFTDVPLARVPVGYSLTVMATDATGESSPLSAPITIHQTGDINADGSVDFNDLVLLAQNYNAAASIAQGDINGDGQVDFNDLVLLAQNYNTSVAAPVAATALAAPETASQTLQSSSTSDVLVKVARGPGRRPVRRRVFR
jgi:hypothetical protein